MLLKTQTSTPVAPGDWLDRYELLCPIAQGGMAEVWIARLEGKRGFEKLVAVKLILPAFASDPAFQQMFLDEARIASRVEHSNVAQILDLGEKNDVLYLVMELVDGEALSTLQKAVFKKGFLLPAGIVLRILADTCGGLHAAHELCGADGSLQGVVHRDLSPQNILVSAKGSAKLIDFGIAKARDRLSDETSAGLIKGKVRYMAPEQALGRRIDRRADVWAIGAILYHLLTGRPPFDESNQLETLRRLTSGEPPPRLPASVHPAIEGVVWRSLVHDPEKRYATAAEMQNALERAMIDAGVVTSANDVAAFQAPHLLDRTNARKEAIALGLAASRERARVEQLLEPYEPPSGISRIQKTTATTARAELASSPSSVISAPSVPRAEPPSVPHGVFVIAGAISLSVVALIVAAIYARSSDSSAVMAQPIAPSLSASASFALEAARASAANGASAPSVAPSSPPVADPTGSTAPSSAPAPARTTSPTRPRQRNVDDGF